MATIANLIGQGLLTKVNAHLSFREFESRKIYLLSRPLDWLKTVLPEAESNWDIQESPAQQADSLFYEFCVGDELPVGRRFKSMQHLGEGVWQLKTADLRFFGWFAVKDVFIISDCDLAERVKRVPLYRGYCEQAQRFREELNLDEPKFVAGDNPDDVVSNWYCAE